MCLLVSHSIAGKFPYPQPAKTLLQILVEELPGYGGWPSHEREMQAVQDGDREVKFHFTGYSLEFARNSRLNWGSNTADAWLANSRAGCNFVSKILASDYATAIITRDQYEAALAASKAVVGHNGWIDWAGGECPVPKNALVDVKLRDNLVDECSSADNWQWKHFGNHTDIIAYRLQQPNEVKTAGIDVQRDAVKSNDAQLEADLNDCIGQPQSNEDARDEILYELANFAATTKTSLDIGVATEIAIWLSGKGYRKQ